MNEHNEQYRKETRELPLDKQIEALTWGWARAIDGQRDLGFTDETIIKSLCAFLVCLFSSRTQAAEFFAGLARDLRSAEATEQSGPATIN